MKKAISFILVLAICLSLCACGKSEAVKNTETLITSIGDVSLESKSAITSARNAYDALTEEEKETVEGYDTLTSAEAELIKLEEHEAVCTWLIGEWVCLNNYLRSPDGNLMTYLVTGVTPSNIEDIPPMIFDANHAVVNGEETTWEVTENTLRIGELEFFIFEDAGVIFLQNDSNVFFIRQDNLDKVITTVELTAENVNDYIEFLYYEIEYVDAFGNGTGEYDCGIATSSKVFNDGLVFWSCDNVAIEILFSDDHYSSLDRNWREFLWTSGSNVRAWEQGNYTVVESPFDAVIYLMFHRQNNWGELPYEFYPDKLEFGNAKGTITFINEEFVDSVSNEGGRTVLLTNGIKSTTGYWCNGVDWPENILK